MSDFTPFADDEAALTIGEFNLENGRDRVAIYGNLDLTRDKAGLKAARILKTVIDAAIGALEADKSLPDKVAPRPAPPTTSVKNPFA
jgi:hypothetical protein